MRQHVYRQSGTSGNFRRRVELLNLYQPPKQELCLCCVFRFIEFIKFVLSPFNPLLVGVKKFFWGRGASIFELGYEYLRGRLRALLALTLKASLELGLRSVLPGIFESCPCTQRSISFQLAAPWHRLPAERVSPQRLAEKQSSWK